ncbi:MAG: HAD-IA family hydrolase [Rhodobacteraceae bacterium]|nr:HAD-IA family hydrolase [Paracoccaceae bacterium]
MRCVIFDLDGTLADTSGDLIAAANSCFRAFGAGDLLDPKRDSKTAMRGARAMLRLGFSRLEGMTEAEHEAAIEAQFLPLIGYYDRAIDIHTYLYPGAMAAVEQLKADGYSVGICTNKPEALAEKLLQSLGIRGAFASLVGSDTLPVRKPDPAPLIEAARRAGGNPARMCLIGDTDTDRNTAKAAKVPSVLVTFGPAGGEMAALAPEALLDHFDQLPDVVTGLGL